LLASAPSTFTAITFGGRGSRQFMVFIAVEVGADGDEDVGGVPQLADRREVGRQADGPRVLAADQPARGVGRQDGRAEAASELGDLGPASSAPPPATISGFHVPASSSSASPTPSGSCSTTSGANSPTSQRGPTAESLSVGISTKTGRRGASAAA